MFFIISLLLLGICFLISIKTNRLIKGITDSTDKSVEDSLETVYMASTMFTVFNAVLVLFSFPLLFTELFLLGILGIIPPLLGLFLTVTSWRKIVAHLGRIPNFMEVYAKIQQNAQKK